MESQSLFKQLKERQSWTLEQKIDHSLGAIDQFYQRMNGKVYVAFSGGKDSTVLLDLCRMFDPNIKAVFCNTGNEFPDIVRFVRNLQHRGGGYNIEIITPELKPKEVLYEYGFPLISKELAKKIRYMKNKPESGTAKREWERINMKHPYKISDKYLFLLNESFDVTEQCCNILKKKPFHSYKKKTGLAPIIGTMACESSMRQTEYIRSNNHCNIFKVDGATHNTSRPLSIWLEDDIYNYIQKRGLEIADIYHSGVNRTGCMFCGFGAHLKGDQACKNIKVVKELYPKCYDMFMNYTNNGVTYKEALDRVLRNTSGWSLDDKLRGYQLIE